MIGMQGAIARSWQEGSTNADRAFPYYLPKT